MSLLPLDEARARILTRLPVVTEEESAPLMAAANRVLARDLAAAADYPRFTQSAMDGYALARDYEPGTRLPIVGRLAAGQAAQNYPTAGAVRIFTGAPLPQGFDRVVIQEHCRAEDGFVVINKAPAAGANVRMAGEDIARTEPLLTAGAWLGPREIAAAAVADCPELPVLRRLRVGVMSTGDELAASGAPTRGGQIHDSNRPMISALVRAAQLEAQDLGQAPDRAPVIADRLRAAAAELDLIITTGGVSVGEEDRLAEAVQTAGGMVELFKIAIRPGKPLAVGQLGNCVLLGLPGNAFSSFVSFALIGRAMLMHMSGGIWKDYPRLPAAAAFGISNSGPRTDYIPVRTTGRDEQGRLIVERAGPPGSARLKPLLHADGLAEAPPGGNIAYIPMQAILAP